MTINITSLIQRATGALLVSLCFALRHHRLLSRSRAAHGFRLTRGLLARRAAPARSAATPMARLPAHGGAARTPAGWLGRLANPYLLPLLLGTLATGTQAVTCQNNLPPRNPDDIYTVDAANGVVTDSRTGLMWKRVEEISTMNWSQALAYAEAHSFAGYSDWRLPNIKELQSLVEECRVNPSINDTVFPGTYSLYVWSGSPFAGSLGRAWNVNFSDGGASYRDRRYPDAVRLVRSEQSFGDLTPPTVSNVSATTTTLTATSNEAATGYWIVVARNATAPTAAQVKARVTYAGVTIVASGSSATGAMGAGVATNFAMTGIAAVTLYDAYIIAEDTAGNQSAPVIAQFGSLQPAPTSISLTASRLVIGGTSTIQPVPGNATLSSCMSSDLNVATVANGLVTAVGRGDVTISCGVATVALHVRRPWVLSISPPTAELGASTTFTVTGYDLDVPLLIQIPGCAALSSGDDPISVFFTPWNVLGTTTRTLKCIAYGAAGTRTLSVRALGTPQNLANFSPPLVVSNPFPLQSTCSLQIGGCTIVVNAATGASASAATFGLFLAIRNQFGGTIPWGTLTSAQIGSVRAQLRAGGVDVSKPAYLSNAMAAELAAVDAKLNGELDAAIGVGLYSTGSIADYFNPSAWAGLANVTVKSYTAADWAKFVSGVGTNAALAVADVFPVGAALSKAARGAKLTKGTSRIAKVIYAATAIPRTAKAVRLARAVIALQPLLEAAQSAGDLWRSMDGKEDIQDAIEELASWSATSDFGPLTQFLANAKTNGRINSFDVGAVNALTNFLIHATVTMGPKMAQDGIDLATINALINAASDAVQDEIPVWGRWKSTWELSGRIAASATAPYFSGVTDMIEESGRVTTARRNFYEALNVQRIFNESSGVTGDQNVALPLLPLSAELPTEWRTMGSVQEMLIATHGWNSAADAWADDLVAALCSQRVGVTQSGTGPESGAAGAFSSGVSKWCYGGGKLFASVNWARVAGTLAPGPAMSHAGDFGDKFADAIGNAGILPSVMHWIGHSAGSYAVQTATQNFATRSGARVVQNTYLDAYCPIPGGCDYGALADWADHYVDSGVWLTNDTRSNAFNIDITTQRPFASILPTAGHGWPYVAYTWSAGGTASYFGASRNGNVFTGIGAPLSVLQRGSQSASQWLISVSQFRPRGIRCATWSLSDPATYSATGRCSGDGVGIGAGSFLPIPSSFGSSSFSQCTVTVTASGKYLLSGCSGTASSSASVATGKLTTTAATVKATARFPITLSAAANQVRLGFRFTQPQGDAILTLFIDDVMVYTNSQARADTVARTTGWIPISGLDIGEHSFQIVLSSQSGVFPPIEFDAPQFALVSRQLAVRFAESSMDFGTVALGASTDRVVTLTNLNPQAVAAPSLSLPVVAGSFSVVSTTCTSLLSAGASCTYSLRFAPVSVGISEGQLSVDTASASSSSRAILLLRGVATNAPACDLKVAGAATVIAERDGLLLLRYMLGFRGSALVQGVTLTSAHPTAQSVELFLEPISRYDIVGRAVPAPSATVDGLILTRLMLGVADTSLLNGITLPAGVQFATAAAIRANVIAKCAGGF